MAAFTSVQSGDFSDGATWGNASPGVKGTDWPGAAGDTAVVTVDHLVKYDADETNEMGAITVNGTLWMPLDIDTKLTFGNVDFTVGATGVLITSSDGTVGNIGVVDKAKHCYVIWNTTSDNSKGPVIADGAYIDVRGDSDLYGGTHTTTLAANWSSGQTLTATGTAPLSWAAGQTFTISRAGAGSRYTIASVAANGDNTDITISEAAPGLTFYKGVHIANEARNVKFYKLGYETPAIAGVSNRPRVDDNHITGTVKWTDVSFSAFYNYDAGRLCTGGTFEFTNCLMRATNGGFYGMCYATFMGVVTHTHVSYGFSTIRNCNFYNCLSGALYNSGAYACIGDVYTSLFDNCHFFGSGSLSFITVINQSSFVNCSFYNIGTVFRQSICQVKLVNCAIWNNTRMLDHTFYNSGLGNILLRNCDIGWCDDVSLPNIYDFIFPIGVIKMQNVKAPDAGYVFSGRNDTDGYRGTVVFDEYNQTPGAWRAYCAYGTITKTASPSGYSSSYCQKVEPLSNCVTFPMYFMGGEKEIPIDGLPFYLPAGATTVKVKVQTNGFTVMPTNSELYFEVQYYDTATSELTTATSTTVVDANDTTKEFSIAVTPNRSDKAYIRGVLKKYEAGAYVLCDTIPVAV